MHLSGSGSTQPAQIQNHQLTPQEWSHHLGWNLTFLHDFSRLAFFNSISKSVVSATPICQNHLSNLPATILIVLQLFSCKSWQICLLATILSSYPWAHCTLSRDIYLSTASLWVSPGSEVFSRSVFSWVMWLFPSHVCKALDALIPRFLFPFCFLLNSSITHFIFA